MFGSGPYPVMSDLPACLIYDKATTLESHVPAEHRWMDELAFETPVVSGTVRGTYENTLVPLHYFSQVQCPDSCSKCYSQEGTGKGSNPRLG